MSTPRHDFSQPQYPSNNVASSISDDEGTPSGEYDRSKLNDTQKYVGDLHLESQSREEEHRINDDLAMLQVERVVSETQLSNPGESLTTSMSMRRSRSRAEPVDQFDVNTNPIHEKTATFKAPEHPIGNTARVIKKVHDSSFLVRYFTYIVPLVALILVPLLLGALVFEQASVGGVRLMWFSVWLEIVWLTLWASRVSFCILPCA